MLPNQTLPAAAPHALGIRFEPDRTYSKADLAISFGVTHRCIEKWIKGRRPQLPRPFRIGRQPYWRGQQLNNFLDRKQAEALA